MGFEREEGDGGEPPHIGDFFSGWKLDGFPKDFKALLHLPGGSGGKESGLITSTIPSLPTPAPGLSVLPPPRPLTYLL